MRSNEYQPGDDELGPVDYLAVEFPGGRISGSGFEELLSLARQGTIRILDAEFIIKDAAGNARKAEAAELGGSATTDISAWAGASSGLLDDADVSHVSAAIQPGAAAAVIVYENRWILEPGGCLAARWRAADRGRRDTSRRPGGRP